MGWHRLTLLAALLLPAIAMAQLEVLGARSLNVDPSTERTSVMVQVRNTTTAPLKLSRLQLSGKPIEELATFEPKGNKIGHDVDWYDIRPAVLPPGQAGTVFIGYARRELVQSGIALVIETSAGSSALKLPAIGVVSPKVASFGFSKDLSRLTLMVRNDAKTELAVASVMLNGMPATVRSSKQQFNITTLELDAPNIAFGQDCCVIVRTDQGDALAWFRAHPAEVVTYMYYSRFADPRDLGEKHIGVGVTHSEHFGEVSHDIDRAGGVLTDPIRKRLEQQAKQMLGDPRAWSWYMQDDAGWGRPRPQSLVLQSNGLRSFGSLHLQNLCNPADNARYAWLSDMYLNYWYFVTHQFADPTVFPSGRSLDLMLRLNEPAPVAYLVDTIGQGNRWITPAEEELASYAMLGRGARHPGWFVGVSLWEQGAGKGGGGDWSETRPWRYQEGVTAVPTVWNQVGRIAGVFEALAPSLSISTRLSAAQPLNRSRQAWHEQNVEVLPLLTHDRLVIASVLNRNFSIAYPRDYADGSHSGGIQLRPLRDVAVAVPLPRDTVRVLAFDHDRGVRSVPFGTGAAASEVRLDALDAAALLIACPTVEQADAIASKLSRVPLSTGGSSIRPHRVIASTDASSAWADAKYDLRVAVDLPADLKDRESVAVRLPLKSDPLAVPMGLFNRASVRALVDGVWTDPIVDDRRVVYLPREHGVNSWRADDDVTMSADATGFHARPRRASGYATVRGNFDLDPAYDTFSLTGTWTGRFVPLLAADFEVDGARRSVTINLETQFVDRSGGTTEVEWLSLLRKEAKAPANARIRVAKLGFLMQLYDGTYSIQNVMQSRSEPVVYLTPRPGSRRAEIYWTHRPLNVIDNALRRLAEGTVRPVDALSIAIAGVESASFELKPDVLQSFTLRTQSLADMVYVESRDGAGTLLQSQRCQSSDQQTWALQRPMPAGAHVSAWVVSGSGNVTQFVLRSPAAATTLAPITKVDGQIETLAAAPDASWVLVGADKVYAIDRDGKPKWQADLGTNRRQQDRFGAGRNVDQVGIRADGGAAFAFTFSFDPKKNAYSPARLITFAPDGRQTGEHATMWNRAPAFTEDGRVRALGVDGKSLLVDPVSGNAESPATDVPAASNAPCTLLDRGGEPPKRGAMMHHLKKLYEIDYPPYPLHRLALSDGRAVIGTTQGVLQAFSATGVPTWSIRRDARFDSVVALERHGLVAVAYKTYATRTEWRAIPMVELIDLSTGATLTSFRGVESDDVGGFGTDLRLAASADASTLFLGDQSGRLYRIDIPAP